MKRPQTFDLPAQDPHKVRPDREGHLESAIGREVKSLRQLRKLTVADLSDITGLSIGMLSKIENGATSPSLKTLQSLGDALGVPITVFFQRFEEKRAAVHTRAGEGVEIEREGTRAGHNYTLLGHLGGTSSGVVCEPYLISLDTEADIFPTFQHVGTEFIYVLTGEMTYRHADQHYDLRPGDTLFFDADAPHGPEKLSVFPIRFLSVISYKSAHVSD